MTMNLLEIREQLLDEDNWLMLDSILNHARVHYVDAVDVSGVAYDYMKESLLESLKYHASSHDELADIDLDALEVANSPDHEQRKGILIWAWEKNYQHLGLDMGEDLDSIIDEGAETLEHAAMRALVAWWDDEEDDEDNDA